MVSNNFQFHGDKILRRSALMIISSSGFPEVDPNPEVLPEVVPSEVVEVVELSYLVPGIMLVIYLTNTYLIHIWS